VPSIVFWFHSLTEDFRYSGNFVTRMASIFLKAGMVSACRANRARS
jgi:hypothetical protein